jgi:hypothetical protein
MSKVNKRKYRIYSGISYVTDELWASWRNGRLGVKKEGLDFPSPPIFQLGRRGRVIGPSSGAVPSSIDIEDILDLINEDDD